MQYSLRGRRRALTGALALACAVHVARAADAPAEGSTHAVIPFDIAPQPLATALLAWGKQSNVQVLTASGTIANWRSSGASGVLTPNAALDELLAGTDLESEAYDARTVVVRQRQKAGNATFEKIERAWVSRNAGKSVSTADFIALASNVSHRRLGPFLHAWLYGTKTPPMPGHPDWHVKPAGR